MHQQPKAATTTNQDCETPLALKWQPTLPWLIFWLGARLPNEAGQRPGPQITNKHNTTHHS